MVRFTKPGVWCLSMKGNGRQDGAVVSVDSIYGMFWVLESHKLLYLRCERTDFSCGSCDLKSCSYTLTTHMAKIVIILSPLVRPHQTVLLCSKTKFTEGFSGPLWYIYVCMYIYIHMYIYIYIYMYMYMYIYYIYTYIHIHMYIMNFKKEYVIKSCRNTYVLYVYIHTYIYIDIDIYLLFKYMYEYIYICICRRTRIYIYIFIYKYS